MYTKDEYVALCRQGKLCRDTYALILKSKVDNLPVNVQYDVIQLFEYNFDIFKINEDAKEHNVQLSDIGVLDDADVFDNRVIKLWCIDGSVNDCYLTDEELVHVFGVSKEDLMYLKMQHNVKNSSLDKLLPLVKKEDLK